MSDPKFDLVRYNALYTSHVRSAFLTSSVAMAMFAFAGQLPAEGVPVTRALAVVVLAFSAVYAVKSSHDFRHVMATKVDPEASAWELRQSKVWSLVGYGYTPVLFVLAAVMIAGLCSSKG